MANRLDEIVALHRDSILRLAAQRCAYNVRVFGSVARGEARANSDVDFLVEFPSTYRLIDHAALLNDLQELLGCPVDVAIEANLREEMRPHILKDAVPL
jgi:uncharacterized protein